MEKIDKKQIFEAIEQIASQNLLTEEETKQLIRDAVVKAFHSKYDPDAELELIIDKENDIFQLFNNTKLIVSDDEYNEEYNAIEVPISKAQAVNPEAKLDDFVRGEVDFTLYSKILARLIRQMFTQTIREKKKEAIFAKHKGLKGEMVEAVVTSVVPRYFKLEDGTPAFMPNNFANPNIKLSMGETVKVYVEDILEDSKDAQIIVSNGSKQVVKRILEEEIPEIQSGIIEIVNISRRPGIRSKVAVKTSEENVDPVGAIIGAKGQRINSIVEKLDGEKLDIILYSDDVNVYVANALSPARVASVIDKTNENGEVVEGSKIAIVPNTMQTLAIGKAGSNVRLAVELVSQRIDVLSIEQANAKGIPFTLNVGLTQADIDNIEQGNKLQKGSRRPAAQDSSFSFEDDLDDSIQSFTNTMEEQETHDDLDIDEDALREMEAAFDIDPDFGDFNLDDKDDESEDDYEKEEYEEGSDN